MQKPSRVLVLVKRVKSSNDETIEDWHEIPMTGFLSSDL